ncbi:MAG TPA: hypothetical protein ENF79_02770 [Nitrososphaeria archaeon]|nr:hypothetical protein [Nitrososphaeria archaeon]
MGWRGGWGWGWSPWPGRGPFSYLPPWLRPGWLFGRGSCWWLFGAPWGLRWWLPWVYGYYPWYGYLWLYPWTSYYPYYWPAYPYW